MQQCLVNVLRDMSGCFHPITASVHFSIAIEVSVLIIPLHDLPNNNISVNQEHKGMTLPEQDGVFALPVCEEFAQQHSILWNLLPSMPWIVKDFT